MFAAAGTSTMSIGTTWSLLGWPSTASVSIRDLWQRADVGVFTGGYNTTVAGHDVFFARLTLQQ